MKKFDIKAFGLASGVLWGVCIFLLGLSGWLFNFGSEWIKLIQTGYIGFEGSFVGSIIGGIWGFLDLFIGGIIFAWLYNKFTSIAEE
jgi:hypothetical protein